MAVFSGQWWLLTHPTPNHAKGGTAGLDYCSEPCHRNEWNHQPFWSYIKLQPQSWSVPPLSPSRLSWPGSSGTKPPAHAHTPHLCYYSSRRSADHASRQDKTTPTPGWTRSCTPCELATSFMWILYQKQLHSAYNSKLYSLGTPHTHTPSTPPPHHPHPLKPPHPPHPHTHPTPHTPHPTPPAQVMKNLAAEVAPILRSLFKESLQTGSLPAHWKTA